jgi:uncharacterized damage-inducible protein DinB
MRTQILALCAGLALLLAPAAPSLAEHPGAVSFANNLDFTGGRIVQLAEAIPADDYGWRPMEGVRSVSEAIMHVASANYFFAGRFGVDKPEGVDTENMETITDKAECVAAVKASLEHLSKAMRAIESPSAEMELFGGRKGTAEDMMLIAVGHAHEHLGQLIAYARSNEVVPPWSQPGDG